MMDLNINLHDSEVGQVAAKVRNLDDVTLVRLGAHAVLGLGAPSAPIMPEPVGQEKRGRKPKADKPAPKKGAKAETAKKSAPRAARVPKDSPELSEACDSIVDQLERHSEDGQTAEQCRTALDMDKKLFVKAIAMLKDGDRIKITGQKRATRYFPKG